jgi:Gas vesicle synthesis protein GvpO
VADNGDHSGGKRGGIVTAVRAALTQFAELTQLEPVAATGVRREEDGWSVLVDVVELERVPATTSVMATYRVDLDRSGEMSGYERLRRFNRGSVDQS